MYALNKSVGIGMENDSLSDLLIETIKNLKFIVFDFDGVFTDNRVMVLQDGTEGVLCSRADGFGLDAAKKMGVELMVL
ncbi:MAG: hypothetical protein HY779_03200 [Rubrobacteridae bacterium]|nr:hypothetical protein [Rubrobacteridae bacterium]